MKLLLIGYSDFDPASRFRLIQYIPFLREHHEVDYRFIRPTVYKKIDKNNRVIFWAKVFVSRYFRELDLIFIALIALKYDVIWINRTINPTPKTSFGEWLFVSLNSERVIFDVDDGIHLIGGLANRNKVIWYLQQSSTVFAGNSALLTFATTYNLNSYLIPSVSHVDRMHSIKPVSGKQKMVIGWIGSHSTQIHCFPLVIDVLMELARVRTDFEVHIVSDLSPPLPWFSMFPLKYKSWVASQESDYLEEFDIGIMPLHDSAFERYKCGMKLIQYGANRIPAVASALGANNSIIEDGKSGFLVTSKEGWFNYLNYLLDHKDIREKMGLFAYQRILEHYSVECMLPEILKILEKFK